MKRVLSLVLLVAVLLSSFTFTAFASEEIVITTDDALCVREGTGWTESTNKGVAGPKDGTSWWTGDKNATVTYKASGLAKGNYGVYLFTVEGRTIADNATVESEKVRLDSSSLFYINERIDQALVEGSEIVDNRVKFF